METTAVETPVVLEEQRYEYQPTDENGLPMGGPQVIKWTPKFAGDTSELIEKLQENNVRMQRKLREANRKNKTGQLDPEDIPENAPRFSPPVAFEEGSLTADDLIEITKGLGDPAKAKESFERLAKATFGAEPAKIREAIKASQQAAIDANIAREVEKFLINTPEYYICTENWNTIYNWMQRFNLDPIESNFKLAFQKLTAADILLTAGGNVPRLAETPRVEPAVRPVAPANYDNTDALGDGIKVEEGPVEIVNFDPSVSAPAPVQRVTTSLTNNNTSISAPPAPALGSDIVYTSPAIYDSKGRLTNPSVTYTGLKALDAMPPGEYEKRLRGEPGFAAKVDKLLASRPVNRNQR